MYIIIKYFNAFSYMSYLCIGLNKYYDTDHCNNIKCKLIITVIYNNCSVVGDFRLQWDLYYPTNIFLPPTIT